MFTVFVSASSELKPLRDAIHDTLEAAGVHAVTQERSLGASPRDVRDLLAKDIEYSDIVIHIAGDQYGADAGSSDRPAFPEQPDFRCSWTQFEYYYAHKLGKDVYAFVMAPSSIAEGLDASAANQDFEIRRQLQQMHRQRIVSGKFDGTPVENAPRTLNDKREVTSDIDMLSRLAGIVRRGQQDWGGRKDRIVTKLDEQTREMTGLRRLSEEQKALLAQVQQTTSIDLVETRRRGLFLVMALVAVLLPVLVIALGGGIAEYGCRLPFAYKICLENNWGNAAAHKAQETVDQMLHEYTKEPDADSFTVEARGSDSNGFYLDIRSNAMSVYTQPYFVQIGESSPKELQLFSNVKLDSLEKVVILKKSEDQKFVIVKDLSTDIIKSLVTTTINAWRQAASNTGIPMWECSIGGCEITQPVESRWLCNLVVAKAEVTQESGDGAWFELDRSHCTKRDTSRSPICVDYRTLPFRVDHTKDFRVRFTFVNEQFVELPVSMRLERDPHNALSKGKNDFWIKAESIDGRNPPGNPPNLLVGFDERIGWVLNSGLEACRGNEESMPAHERGRWLVDWDGKGLVAIDNYDTPLYGPKFVQGRHPVIPTDSDLGRIIASGDAIIAVAKDAKDGTRRGPFWYRFDARKPVSKAARRLLADHGQTPEVRCVTPYKKPAFCRPLSELEWVDFRSVEFGVSAEDLDTKILVNFRVEDYLASTCADDGLPCVSFNYVIPPGASDVYFRTTDGNGKISQVSRIQIQQR
jgi:hypothetical protein